MAMRFPGAVITAVSNAAPQRLFIEAEARRQGLGNIRVLTADMNDFNIDETFDRIVSVEMFEHMANWLGLLTSMRHWLAPETKLFLHVFSHASQPYRFEVTDEADWIARYFFTGGIMPSHDLIHEFDDLFRVERGWRWNCKHY
jgi:cyclopropane-fatty-acyl-phospholipid synthase